MDSTFYIYAYLRTDGTPYYIGKGTGGRAWSKRRTIPLPTNLSNIIIMENNLSDIGALALERRYIRWYGRKDNGTGILRNLTDGGDGKSGCDAWNKGIATPPETKAKLSKALKGRPAPNRGKSPSPETKAKLKAAALAYRAKQLSHQLEY